MRSPPICAVRLLSIMAFASNWAAAQSNAGDIPLGGRSTLLGGTGIALGRDGASPFLNPATMGRIADHRLAFSVHFYRYSTGEVERLFIPPPELGNSPSDASRRSLGTQPASFCAFVTLAGLIPDEANGLWRSVRGKSGRVKLGLCGATLERERYAINAESRSFSDGSQRGDVAYDSEHLWQRQSVGPAISYQISPGLTVGASLQVVTSTASQSWDIAAVVDRNNAYVYQHHLVGSAVDGVTTIGVNWSKYPITVGAAVRLPSVNLVDTAQLTHFVASPQTSPLLLSGKGRFVAPLLPTVSIGTGAEWNGSALEFDVSASLPSRSGIRTELGAVSEGKDAPILSSKEATRAAVAFRVGGEWLFSQSLSLLAGARWEPSNVRTGFSQPAYRLGPVNRQLVASSVGLGSYGRGTELLVGVELSHSFGKMSIVRGLDGDASYAEVQHRDTSLLLVLSGSVGFSAVKQTWKSFKALTPRKPDN